MHKKLNKLILIIDDSVDNQALLKMIFEVNGFQVHCASNGKEALCLLQELSNLPNVILLDAQMPVMDGYQFRQEQSKNERIKDIPVVVMTGDDDSELYKKMIMPEGILMKPLHLNSLIESVSIHL